MPIAASGATISSSPAHTHRINPGALRVLLFTSRSSPPNQQRARKKSALPPPSFNQFMATWWWSSQLPTEMVANNWDLHAVVRGCTATPSVDDLFFDEGRKGGEDSSFSFFPDTAAAAQDVVEDLQDLCRPFLSAPQEELLPETVQRRPQEEEPHRRVSQNPRSKRRKNQQKKVVCQVPADGLPYDMWAWRKYGQKPIKGSPYPRGYYRCSSSKGCLARKQVERSRTDPTMLVITYTAEHNHPVPTHRNSLAGSTRSKFPPLPSRQGEQTSSGSLSPTLTMARRSPTTPLKAAMEDNLLMPKGESEYNNDDDEDEEGLVPLEKLKDDIDDDDLIQKFFSNVWQTDGRTSAGGG